MEMVKDLVSKRLPSTLPLPKKIEKNLEATTLLLQFLAAHTHLFNIKPNQIIMLLWVQRHSQTGMVKNIFEQSIITINIIQCVQEPL